MEPEMTQEEERARTEELLRKMGRHVAMAAFVGPEPATPYSVVNNGTASFLELPKGKFIVTNHHVWDGFQQQRNEVPGLRLAVMGEECPFVMLLAHPDGGMLKLMAACWLYDDPPPDVDGERERLGDFLNRAFAGLNQVMHLLAFGDELTRVISETASRCLVEAA